MQWTVLGRVTATVDGRTLAVGRPQQRGVLAYLLINANLVISPDRLEQALWGVAAPASARAQVYGYVSRLRRVLGPHADDVLTGGSAGYRLTAATTDLDLSAFTDLTVRARAAVADRRPADAAPLYRSALALWTGTALADAAGAFVAAAALRLEEHRLVAAEELADVELGLGRHATLVPELCALVQANPLRERMIGHLMLALYRGGRQAEALAVFDRFRRTLGSDHGLDPGCRLADLHRSIIRSDPALLDQPARPAVSASRSRSAVTEKPAHLPSPVADFVGRRDQLRALTTLLPAGRPAKRTTIAITGTAGVGKTALAVHWAHLVADRFPDGQLYANLRGFDPAGVARDPADVLGFFLAALQVACDRIPADPDGRAGLYRSVLAGKRLLILLDNARDADHVRPLLPGAAGCLVLVTSRDQLTGLVAADGARQVPVEVMSPDESRRLLAARLGPDRLAAESDVVDDIVARCAGLPLALAVAAARATRQPTFPLRALAEQLRGTPDPLDPFTVGDDGVDIRPVLSSSYRALRPPAARLFRLLGLHRGADLSVAAAASLAGVAASEAASLLFELTRASLLTEHRPGRYTCHDLLRAYAAGRVRSEEPATARRHAVHRMLDHYLHTAVAAKLLLSPSHPAVVLGTPLTGVTTEALPDHDGAFEWFATETETLLALVARAAEAGFERQVWQLTAALTDFLDRQGRWADLIGLLETTIAAAARAGETREQALAHRLRARMLTRTARYEEAGVDLDRALDLFRLAGDRGGRADTLMSRAFLLHQRGRHREALRQARQVPPLHRSVGDRYSHARALNNVGWLYARVGDHDQALVHCESALALFQEVDDRRGQAHTWDSLGFISDRMGRPARAVECFRQAVRLIDGLGDRHFEAGALTRLGDAHAAAGDAVSARQTWTRALSALRDLDHSDAERVDARLHTAAVASSAAMAIRRA